MRATDLFHVGMVTDHSDDVAADAGGLERRGLVAEALRQEPGGPPAWGYLARPGAPRIELVSRAMQPYVEQSWTAAP